MKIPNQRWVIKLDKIMNIYIRGQYYVNSKKNLNKYDKMF